MCVCTQRLCSFFFFLFFQGSVLDVAAQFADVLVCKVVFLSLSSCATMKFNDFKDKCASIPSLIRCDAS